MQANRRLLAGVGVAAVIVIVIVLVVVKTTGGSSSGSTHVSSGTGGTPGLFGPTTSAGPPPEVVQEITGVSVQAMVAAAMAAPTGATAANGAAAPVAISGPTSLGGAHPQLLYIGAEFCPYCAAERWPLVMALSKFGTLTGLQATSSSSTDVNPDTPTFSFVDARFASPYLSFTARETADRDQHRLQSLTQEQTDLANKYDAAPYVASSNAGSIPFVLFGSQALLSGAQYDAAPLSKMSFTEAASILSAPVTGVPTSGTAATSLAAKAAAGHLLGAICAMTGDQPADVCSLVPASLKPTAAG